MIKKVLIATDGSENAARAVAFGADIAAKYGADLVLVHVLLRDELSENLRHAAEVEHLAAQGGQPLSRAIASVPFAHYPANILFTEGADSSADAVLRAVAEHVLDNAEEAAREHGAGRITRRVEDGNPAKRIVEAVYEEKADLVVTGARGLSDIASLLTGSVSHKVSHLSPVTCVTVR
jgi:nucleotide-binding universal stress UspA family protein